MSIPIGDNDYFFLINRNYLKDRIHIASSFHKDGTLWSNGGDYVEIINNQNIKVKIIIPIMKTNIGINTPRDKPKPVKHFYFNYNMIMSSVKNMDCEDILLIYTDDGDKIKIYGVNTHSITVNNPSVANITSISAKEDDDHDYYNFNEEEEYNTTPVQDSIVSTLENYNVLIKTHFVDSITVDKECKGIYHTIDISSYKDIIGTFVLSFQDLIFFINKLNTSKINKVAISLVGNNVELCGISKHNGCDNIIKSTYINTKNVSFDEFNIDVKILELFKGINVAITNNKKKDKKIYNHLIFNVVRKRDSVYGLNVKPNNIKDTSHFSSSDCFFIFIPSLQ